MTQRFPKATWSTCILSLVVALLPSLSLFADDWPRWMGPKSDGIWREADVMDKIPEQGLSVSWRVPIQGGYSGPAVADGRLYVMDFLSDPVEGDTVSQRSRVGSERVLCLDCKTGAQIWKHEYATELKVSYPGGPRSTPTVDQERVYVQGTMGEILCLDAETGEVLWQRNVAEEYGTKPPVWGYASHPLIVEDLLICAAGGEGTGIVAMDKHTGKERWTAITAREIGYAPLVVAEILGRQQLVVWYDVAIAGIDIASGDELWSHAFPEAKPMRPVVAIVPPLVLGNRVFVTNYYHGSTLFEVKPDSAEVLWSTENDAKHLSDINSIMSTVVATEDALIGVAGNGELRCVAKKDGELKWRSYQALATSEEDPNAIPRGNRGFPSLFVISHRDLHWLFTDQGDLICSRLSSEGYQEFGRTNLLETTATTRGRDYVWCAPACCDGRMYVRNEKELICVDLRASSYKG